MNKKEKKVLKEFEDSMPEKNLFNRIEGKVDYAPKAKKIRKPLIGSLISVGALGLVCAIVIPVALAKNMGGASNSGSLTPGEYDATTDEAMAPGEYDATTGEAMAPGYGDETLSSESGKGEVVTSGSQTNGYKKTLTASENSDIKTLEKYIFWRELVSGNGQGDKNFNPSSYESIQKATNNVLSTLNMVVVTLKDGNGTPLNQAKVTLSDSKQKTLFECYSNAKGYAYVFLPDTFSETLVVSATYKESTKSINIDEVPQDRIVNCVMEDVTVTNVDNIDLVFTIDTTGSMGDELAYLQKETINIINDVIAKKDNFNLKVGIVLYRDVGDTYVTKSFDFTSNYSEVTSYLEEQNATGGGDNPEAVHEALRVTNELSWRENSTKLCFHIYDAPCHDDKIADLYSQYIVAANKGIRLIPVICSGYMMKESAQIMIREEAIITGGTCAYVTNDSGIGGNHDSPTTQTPLIVEYLEDLIVRVIFEYATGEEKEPIPFTQTTTEVQDSYQQ